MDYNSSGKHTVIWLSHPGGGTHHVSLPWVSAKEIDHHGVAPILSVYDPIQRAQIKVRPEACYVMDSLRPGIDWLELSIPIEFISDSTQVGYQCTFWFLPSDELFNCLPDGIGEAMRKEYNYNVKPKIVELVIIEDFHPTKTENTVPKEAQPCVYFPSFCEGLSGLDNLNIYPNPVGDQLSVEVTLNRAKRIDYRIFDLAGRQVNLDYLDKKYPDSGIYTENFDMQALKPGFYLLVLTDLEGGKMTKRLVKE